MNSQTPHPKFQGKPPEAASQAGVSVSDILHAIFRRKWIILGSCAAALLAATLAFFCMPTVYRSDAKLLVKYVREAKNLDAVDGNTRVKMPDSRGENIINSELEILSSYDLAHEVAESVGPAKILRSRGSNTSAAAAIILIGLTPDVPRKSDVIKISFQHRDPEVAHAVLKALVDAYLKKHIEVHRALGLADNFLSQQVDQLRQKLAQTEEALRQQRSKLGVISVEDSKKSYADQLTKLHQEILAAEAELAELRRGQTNQTAGSSSTNSTLAPSAAAVQENPFKDATDRYTAVRSELTAARSKEVEMSVRYTDESPALQQLRHRIQELELTRKKLEAENPSLTSLPVAISAHNTDHATTPAIAIPTTASLESRLRILGAQYEKVRSEAAALDEADSNIRSLQRTRDTVEANYRYFAQNLEQARIDESLDPAKMPNINKVQEPSPAYPVSQKRAKQIGLIFVGIALLGIGLTLLVEIFVDQSIRKPSDLEARFHIPLWISIPDMAANGHRSALATKLVPWARRRSRPASAEPRSNGFDLDLAMRPYCEALRDRLVSSFRARNLNHIPKLIAVTSCGRNSGVTGISTQLARTLCENDDGNVLLVRLDSQTSNGKAHSNGDGFTPPVRAEEAERREASEAENGGSLRSAFASEADSEKSLSFIRGEESASSFSPEPPAAAQTPNGTRFEVISVSGANGHQTEQSLRVKFASVLAKVKTSKLDYIVFDLPSVGQTSVTPFLSDMMDVVLLVIEAEKTPRQSVKRALNLLENARSPVATILNKRRDYLPRWLEPEV